VIWILKLLELPKGNSPIVEIKIDGITEEIFFVALEKGLKERTHILFIMDKEILEFRTEISEKAAKGEIIEINKKKIRDVIGKGGETIRSLVELSGAQIDVDDSGIITIYGDTLESREVGIEKIKEITAEPEINKIYTGIVASIVDFGAFVIIM
jgi:Polyribonucleotide nucleotidyltransferase (polynucleotide phosphorylase)